MTITMRIKTSDLCQFKCHHLLSSDITFASGCRRSNAGIRDSISLPLYFSNTLTSRRWPRDAGKKNHPVKRTKREYARTYYRVATLLIIRTRQFSSRAFHPQRHVRAAKVDVDGGVKKLYE